MCPLRIILVFLSATLAGYLAWKSVRKPGPSLFEIPGEEEEEEKKGSEEEGIQFGKKMSTGFWMFVDMASGKYLWRNLAAKNS